MKPIGSFEGRLLDLQVDDVDTDQIIPARFLTTVSREGLGRHLFHDWRFDPSGTARPAFALNQPGAAGASLLLAGANFGCGSSREHAVWALVDFGFQAVIAPSFADIFRANALKNGLLPVVVDRPMRDELARLARDRPEAAVGIDLARQLVIPPDGRAAQFPIDAFARRCLLEGLDELGYVLGHAEAIARYEARHPPVVDTTRVD